MSLPRRTFLQGLTKLPLIGGGLSLIGQRRASAGQVTNPELKERYLAWLANEHAYAAAECDFRGPHHIEHYAWLDLRRRQPLHWFPEGHEDVERKVLAALPSSRAALVLSAVGCDWEDRR